MNTLQSAANRRVLLVEDDQMLVDMYKDRLKSEGFRVRTATDGKKALIRIKEGADIILLDVLMPGMNGFEVLRKIRSDDKSKDIPVIILTNIGSETTDSDKNLALSLGATDFMVKSLHTPDEIIQKIYSVLD